MTDTLRGRFEKARQKWIEDEYGQSPVPQLFLDSFDSGYKAAQPTSTEIEELARRIADMPMPNPPVMEVYEANVAELLREYLGGKTK